MQEQKLQEKLAGERKEGVVRVHCGPRCPRCQDALRTVYVHGHEQCTACGCVIEDCCQGEVSCESVEQKNQ